MYFQNLSSERGSPVRDMVVRRPTGYSVFWLYLPYQLEIQSAP